MLTVNESIQVPLREFSFSYVRSSGPGGQNVNKLNTKAQLRWNVDETQALPEAVRERLRVKFRQRITKEGELVLSSQRFRDQGRNTADCLAKLREMILQVVPTPVPRKKTKPSAGSKRRRREGKESVAAKKKLRKPPRSDFRDD